MANLSPGVGEAWPFSRGVWYFLSVASLAGCAPDLNPPLGTSLSCTRDGQCPSGFVCQEEVERCVREGEELTPPIVSIERQRVQGGQFLLDLLVIDSQEPQVTIVGTVPSGPLVGLVDFEPNLIPASPVGEVTTIVWEPGVTERVEDIVVDLVAEDIAFESEVISTAPFALGGASIQVADVAPPPSGTRHVESLPLSISLDDPEGATGLQLVFEYSVDDGASWYPAVLSGPGLQNLTNGAVVDVVWDFAASAALAGSPLQMNTFLVFEPQVRLRGFVTDDLGNDSTVRDVTVDGESLFSVGHSPVGAELDPFQGAYVGAVPLTVALRDPAQDLASVEAQFRLTQTGASEPWRRMSLTTVAEELRTGDPNPPVSVLLWDSTTPPNADANAPQGIGGTWVDEIEVRVRASDLEDGVLRPGPWSSIQTIAEVRNQTPPEAKDVELVTGHVGGTSPFAVSFRLVDAESDLADIRLSVSLDGGDRWIVIPEYGIPESAGLRDLPTSPENLNGTGGVRHRVFLDPSGFHFGETPAGVSVRVESTNGLPVDAPRVSTTDSLFLSPPGNIGFEGNRPVWQQVTAEAQQIGLDGELADLNNDGLDDIVFTVAGPAIAIAYGLGRGEFSSPPEVLALDTTGLPPVVPYTVAAGDFNGDGRTDMVVGMHAGANDYEAGISIFYGASGGGFTQAPNLIGFARIEYLYTYDFNKDGFDDVFFPTRRPSIGLRVLMSEGPQFAAPVFYSTSGEPRRSVVGDFNGDGFADIFSNDWSGNRGTLYVGETAAGMPTGTFDGPHRIDLPAPGNTLATADLNGDGLSDLVTADGEVRVLLNQGGAVPSFLEEVIVDSHSFSDVLLDDFNADGLVDLAYGESDPAGATSFNIALNVAPSAQSDPDFWLSSKLPMFMGPPFGSFATGNMDGDDRPDILLVTGPQPDVEALYTLGVTPPTALFSTFELEQTGQRQLENGVIADFDGDGVAEAVFFYRDDDVGHVLMLDTQSENGVAGRGGEVRELFTVSVNDGLSIGSGDINGDGAVDLLLARPWAAVEVWLNVLHDGVPAGTFAMASSIPTGSYLETVCAGDVDGDGHNDVLAGQGPSSPNPFVGVLHVYLGDGTGALAPSIDVPTSIELFSCRVADVDENGTDDVIVMSTTNSNSVGIGLAPASPTPGSVSFNFATWGGVQGSGETQVGDVNEDGIDDVLVAGRSGGIYVLYGNGSDGASSATFQAPEVVAPSGQLNQMQMADINGDGVMDFVGSGRQRSAFGRRLGGGAFAFEVVGDGTGGISPTLVDDLDRDGVADSMNTNVGVSLEFGIGSDSIERDVRVADVLQGVWSDASRWPAGQGPAPTLTSELDRLPATDAIVPLSVEAAMAKDIPGLPRDLVPISGYHKFSGDRRWEYMLPEHAADVYGVGAGGERWRVAPRLGALVDPGGVDPTLRAGLRLDGTGQGLAVKVRVPLWGHADPADTSDPNRIRLYVRYDDVRRANEFPDDPLSGHARASELLPMVSDTLGELRLVLMRTQRYAEVPYAAVPLADGPSFVRVVDNGAVWLEVTTDRLGSFRAYVQRP